ncbi:hypothetical protein SLEP1_g20535 [Rubroshorea leprosula]|uniref:Uncharacterized protein n=1 Tax=Rubroshorea leprosula TaxID=152421 RepID=A0AAV5JDJ2_9ROSI|nr:hypothetical protein SLEP1_g20535 [Rubroshorea leprosula]
MGVWRHLLSPWLRVEPRVGFLVEPKVKEPNFGFHEEFDLELGSSRRGTRSGFLTRRNLDEGPDLGSIWVPHDEEPDHEEPRSGS